MTTSDAHAAARPSSTRPSPTWRGRCSSRNACDGSRLQRARRRGGARRTRSGAARCSRSRATGSSSRCSAGTAGLNLPDTSVRARREVARTAVGIDLIGRILDGSGRPDRRRPAAPTRGLPRRQRLCRSTPSLATTRRVHRDRHLGDRRPQHARARTEAADLLRLRPAGGGARRADRSAGDRARKRRRRRLRRRLRRDGRHPARGRASSAAASPRAPRSSGPSSSSTSPTIRRSSGC